MMQRIMNEGGLIPYQLTVQVLVNALIEQPSKVSAFERPNSQFHFQPSNRYLLELSDWWFPTSCWPSYLFWISCWRSVDRTLLQHSHWSMCCKMPGTSKNQRTIWWHWRNNPQETTNLQRAIDCCCGTLRKIRQSSLSWWKWWPDVGLEAYSISDAPSSKLYYWSSGIRQIYPWLKTLRTNKRQTSQLQWFRKVKWNKCKWRRLTRFGLDTITCKWDQPKNNYWRLPPN